MLQQALSIRQQVLGSEHKEVAECLLDIGYIEAQQNKMTEAEQAYVRALASFTKRLIESLQTNGTQTRLTDAYKTMKAKVEEEALRDRSVMQTPIIKTNWTGGEVQPLMQIPGN